MAIYKTPISLVGYNDELVTVLLDSKSWFFRFSWNESAQRWYMAINDYEDHTLIRNIPLIANARVGEDYLTYDSLPEGVFYIESTREDDVLRDDFQNGIATLYYYYEQED